MDTTPVIQPDSVPRHLSPSSSGRRPSNASPEFEFWTTNAAATSPLISADELFVNGVLLPLHLLHLHPNHKPTLEITNRSPDPIPDITNQSPDPTHSKRWKDIFKKGNNTNNNNNNNNNSNKKKSERIGTELNINIWPFSRSRSAGTGPTRTKPVGLARKVSSAPCSRSNSAGESKSRKWPASPGRVGVHLGRASPVWQARKPKQSKLAPAKPRVLNLNVPMCIGYRNNHVGCKSEESGTAAVDAGDGTRGSNMFNLRNLFNKKVY